MNTKCYWDVFKDCILYVVSTTTEGFRMGVDRNDRIYLLAPLVFPERNFKIPLYENSTNSYPRVPRWSGSSND